MRNLQLLVIASVLALALSGCTGTNDLAVGEMKTEFIRPPISGPEETLRQAYAMHPEFRNQYGLGQIGADYAYARGATGAGVTLGIVDTGIDPTHPKFEGKLETRNVSDYHPDFSACPMPSPDGSCLSSVGHGTFVGGIMAAGRHAKPGGAPVHGDAIHGVAFNAQVISVGFRSLDQIIEDTPPEDLSETINSLESRLEQQFAEAFTDLNGRVTAVNASFGLPGNIEASTAEELRQRFPNVINAIAQADTPAGERTIYVWSAGNSRGEVHADGSIESGSSVEIVAGLPARLPELRGHSLAVVATDPEGKIAAFSNRCGIAGDFCLAAPGVDIVGPVPAFYCPAGTKECYQTIEFAGTSSAAPFVTGGIGLLAQYYRGQLGNDEIVQRLLATTNRQGEYANSELYGQGFMDLEAATRPVGETRLLTGDSLSGPSALSHHSTFHPGTAFGDALTRGWSRVEVASFDALDAPFFHPMGDFLPADTRQGRLRPEDRLRTLGQDPLGMEWHIGRMAIRLQIDATSESQSIAVPSDPDFPGGRMPDTPDWLVTGVPGSLSLEQDMGLGVLWFGYRDHPGKRFGPYVGDVPGHSPRSIRPDVFTDADAFANPWAGFARNGISFGLSQTAGPGTVRMSAFHSTGHDNDPIDPSGGETQGFLAEYRFDKPSGTEYAIQGGRLTESGGVAGSRSSRAFGEPISETHVMGLSIHRPLGIGWRLLASAHAGLSESGMRHDGMIQDLSTLWSSAFSLGVVGNRMGIRLSQPLRVESGHADLRWISGRTADGQVEVGQTTVALEPSGRQLDLELVYSLPWAGGETHLASVVSRDAGHTQGEREAMLLVRYRRTF